MYSSRKNQNAVCQFYRLPNCTGATEASTANREARTSGGGLDARLQRVAKRMCGVCTRAVLTPLRSPSGVKLPTCSSGFCLTTKGFDQKHATVGSCHSHNTHRLTARARQTHIIAAAGASFPSDSEVRSTTRVSNSQNKRQNQDNQICEGKATLSSEEGQGQCVRPAASKLLLRDCEITGQGALSRHDVRSGPRSQSVCVRALVSLMDGETHYQRYAMHSS